MLQQKPTRAGAGKLGSASTGGTDGTRQGNTPAIVIDIDAPPQRIRPAMARSRRPLRNDSLSEKAARKLTESKVPAGVPGMDAQGVSLMMERHELRHILAAPRSFLSAYPFHREGPE